MHLIAYTQNHQDYIGLLEGEHFYRIAAQQEMTMLDFLQSSTHAQQRIAQAAKAQHEAESLQTVQLLYPLSHPGKILCLGLNYADHAKESGHQKPEFPSIFLRSKHSLLAAEEAIWLPACSEKLDYEAELAVIIKTTAKHVSVDQALDIVGGYSCFNDVSVRDYQHKTSQWTLGKNFDRTGPFGPSICTPDAVPPGATGLAISTSLNGRIVQEDNTDNMLFPVAETIALLSECMTLEAGDVIVMGTPAGVGSARKPQLWMRPGDTVEIYIEKIGTLRNTIVSEP